MFIVVSIYRWGFIRNVCQMTYLRGMAYLYIEQFIEEITNIFTYILLKTLTVSYITM